MTGAKDRIKSLTVKEVNDDDLTFTAYLSTYGNTDREGDVIEKGAFDDSIKAHPVVPMLFNHERNAVIGKLELSSDDKGLKVVGTFNSADSEAVKIYNLIKMQALDSMSVGMAIKDYKPVDPERAMGGWTIKSADVYEGSVVTIPANEEAKINQVKALSESERKELETLRHDKALAEKKSQILNEFE